MGAWLPGCADDSRAADAEAANGARPAGTGAERSPEAGAQGAFAPLWTAHACAMPIPAELRAQDFRCGTLTVAADRDRPASGTLAIEVAVLTASGAAPRPDPVVFLGGGPGASSLDGYLQTHAARVLAPIRMLRDIVFFDQRGTGRSRPSLACPEEASALVASLTRNDSPAQERGAGLDGFRDCRARLDAEGLDLSVYHSAAVAQDVSELMQALGYHDYNVYGISYGGRIAQVLLRDRPDRVRTAILDASVLPEDNVAGSGAASLAAALQHFFADCVAAGACRADHEESLYRACAQLDAAPFVSAPLPEAGGASVMINGHRALLAVQAMLSPERSGLLPILIDQLAAGRYAPLAPAAAALLPDPVRATTGFYASVICAEELPFEDAQTLAQTIAGVRAELVETRSGEFHLELCRRWSVPARPALENESVISDVQTLILHGGYDPSVHPSASERAHRNLERSQYFAFPGVGHGVLRTLPGGPEQPSCAQQLVLQFLERPDVAVDGSCADSGP